jgi:hypothetical protein
MNTMIKTAITPDVAKMEAALNAVATELDEATDILHYEGGQPVTALEGWQIERIFGGLRSVMVQVDEALRHQAPPKKKAEKSPRTPGQNERRPRRMGRSRVQTPKQKTGGRDAS